MAYDLAMPVGRYGVLVALTAASMLVHMLFVGSGTSKACVLAAHVVLLFGCGAVLLSPAHRAVAALARRGEAVAMRCYGVRVALARQGEAAAMRCYGVRVALAAASVLVHMLFVDSGTSKACMLAAHAVLLFGCGAVLLSPAHRIVDAFARRGQAAASELFDAPPAEACAGRELRWAGFAYILFYGMYAWGDVTAGPATATEMSVDQFHYAFLPFLMFLAGVWMLSLSMLRGRTPTAAAVQEVDGVAV